MSEVTEDELSVGPGPCEELCAQLGTETYPERSRIECQVFKRMLARLFPIPDGVQAKLEIKLQEYEIGMYREVFVRSVGASGWDYALQVEHGTPHEWDEVAHAELIWYCVRRALNIAKSRSWVDWRELPGEFGFDAPPAYFPAVLKDSQPIYSPAHIGGPFDDTSRNGSGSGVSASVFSPWESGVILGRLDCDLGPGFLIRLKDTLSIIRTDLREIIAVVSENLNELRFSVDSRSTAVLQLLRSTEMSKLVQPGPGRVKEGRKEYWSIRKEIWSGGISLTLGG